VYPAFGTSVPAGLVSRACRSAKKSENKIMKKIVFAALCAAMTGVVSLPAEAKTVTDVLGRQVEVPDNPQRVLLGFYFEDFYAIVGDNAYDRVVGISRGRWHDWRNSQWKAYAKVAPKIEDFVDIGMTSNAEMNLESALAARPDVAILAAAQYKALGETAEKLEAAGVPIVTVDFNAQTVPTHVASALTIGAVMGTEERAKKLADEYQAAVADVQARIAKAGGEKKRVYVELGNKGAGEYSVSYAKQMWGGVIDLAGGANIADGAIEGRAPLNPEHVLASNPQVVLIAGSYWTRTEGSVVMGFGVDTEKTKAGLRPYTGRAGWSELDAVKNGQVYAVYHGGARTLYDYALLQYIAKALYPEAFADVDPQATLERFYETYLPIRAEGSFMVHLD